jgi:predicted ester cyclase
MKILQFRFVSAILLVALLLVASGCQSQSEKAELDRFKAIFKAQEQNKTIVRDFFVAVDRQDFDKLNALLSEDFTLTAAGLEKPWTKDDVFKDIKKYYTSFPDWHHEIEGMIAEGDKVAVKLNQNGTQTAQFEEITPTGVKVTKSAFHLVTIVNGKIKEWWGLEDDLGLMLQLGMVLKPKEEKK